jgi:hypothetical protein
MLHRIPAFTKSGTRRKKMRPQRDMLEAGKSLPRRLDIGLRGDFSTDNRLDRSGATACGDLLGVGSDMELLRIWAPYLLRISQALRLHHVCRTATWPYNYDSNWLGETILC